MQNKTNLPPLVDPHTVYPYSKDGILIGQHTEPEREGFITAKLKEYIGSHSLRRLRQDGERYQRLRKKAVGEWNKMVKKELEADAKQK